MVPPVTFRQAPWPLHISTALAKPPVSANANPVDISLVL